jgi:adenine nucleotide transporter 17
MSLSKVLDTGSSLLISEQALNVILHGISGALAGCLSTMLLYPIDNVKLRLQAMANAEKETALTDPNTPETDKSDKSENYETLKKSPTVTGIFKEILEKDGVAGLYKGMPPFLVGTLAHFGIYFFWYELFKIYFIKGDFSAWRYIITALFAGLITSTATNPIWIIHTRILLSKNKNVGVIETIQNIIKEEGFAGFGKGLGACYVLVINPIIQFVLYEYLKRRFANSKYRSAMVFITGAISKALASMFTYPYQILKTNLQANKGRSIGQFELFKEIFESKGFKGFYRGFAPKLSTTVINSALMLLFYERLQTLVRKVLIMLLTKR